MPTQFDTNWVGALPPIEVYKEDRRSKVWRVDAPDGQAYVIKRFTHDPLKQRLAYLTGTHPGQREARACKRLDALDVPVVPIVAQGVTHQGIGLGFWLATPHLGTSLYHLFYREEARDAVHRDAVIDAVGRLTALLTAHKLFNRDHKASNIVVDAKDRPRLIDVGGVRRQRSRSEPGRMLVNLRANLAEAGATPADLARLVRSCRQDPASD